jgi:hypothetical protein
MGIYFFILLVMIISMSMYNRYFPIKSVPCIKNGFKDQNAIILDIRDYHISGNNENHSIETLNIPYSYLKRYLKGMSHHKIHLIASDRLELNLGLRFLLRKGFEVSSYEIMDCPCKTKGA